MYKETFEEKIARVNSAMVALQTWQEHLRQVSDDMMRSLEEEKVTQSGSKHTFEENKILTAQQKMLQDKIAIITTQRNVLQDKLMKLKETAQYWKKEQISADFTFAADSILSILE
jgi:Tat protein secretion system quality control protein TatD with DNase activity